MKQIRKKKKKKKKKELISRPIEKWVEKSQRRYGQMQRKGIEEQDQH